MIQAASKAGEDIRAVGSDIQVGQTVLQAGDMLGPAEIGILATVGTATLKVMSAAHLCHTASADNIMLHCTAGTSQEGWVCLLQGAQSHALLQPAGPLMLSLPYQPHSGQAAARQSNSKPTLPVCSPVIQCATFTLLTTCVTLLQAATFWRTIAYCRCTGRLLLQCCQQEMRW